MTTNLRARFTDTMVSTASPEQILTMCYDRLVRDLGEARSALHEGRVSAAHQALVHAQDLLFEMERSVNTSLWPEGRELRRLYRYAHEQLMAANMRKQVQPVSDALAVIEPLREAFYEAFRSGNTR